jgi:prophage regulatory protein
VPKKDKEIFFKEANHRLPEEGYLRLWQIIGGKGCPAILPISKSSFWTGVRTGRFPKPVKLGKRTTAWRVQDIRALIEGETAQ